MTHTEAINDMSDDEVEAAIKKEAGYVQWNWSGPGRPVTAVANPGSDAMFTVQGEDRTKAARKLLTKYRAYQAGTFVVPA